MSTFSVSSILEKMNSNDRDFRYMAVSDLLSELQKESFKVDLESYRKISRKLLQTLEDSSGEVQGLAVKCLPPLLLRVSQPLTEEIIDKLALHVTHIPTTTIPSQMSSGDEVNSKSMRDIGSLGLKSIINELPPSSEASGWTARKLVPHLLLAIQNDKSKEQNVRLDVLDIMQELLAKFPHWLGIFHEDIKVNTIPLLYNHNHLVRKRSAMCLSYLSVSCSEIVFHEIVKAILDGLQNSSSKPALIRSFAQAIASISKISGHRLSQQLSDIVPILIHYCSSEEYNDEIEVQEQCFLALETFTLRSRKKLLPYLDSILDLVVIKANYDPNYAPSDGEDDDDQRADDNNDEKMQESGFSDDDDADDDDSDQQDDDYPNDDYSDDDDSSWKVRRAAVRTAHAVITGRSQLEEKYYTKTTLLFVAKLKEREETVKLDVFTGLRDLIEVIRKVTEDPGFTKSDIASLNPSRELLMKSKRVKNVIKTDLASKSIKSRIEAMELLHSLVKLLKTDAITSVLDLQAEIQNCLNDANVSLKSSTLALLKTLVKVFEPAELLPLIQNYLDDVIIILNDKYYKLSADSIRLCTDIITTFGKTRELREPLRSQILKFYRIALEKLKASDQDSEVKNSSIACLCQCMSLFGEYPEFEVKESIPVLIDRLDNEVTRTATVRALTIISKSANNEGLTPWAEQIESCLCAFLKKNDVALRHSSLEALCVMSSLIPESQDKMLLSSIAPSINDEDLRLAGLAIELCTRLIPLRKEKISPMLNEEIFSNLLVLLQSPLLQNYSVDTILEFVSALMTLNAPPLTFEKMHKEFLSLALNLKSNQHVQVTSVSKCIATLCHENIEVANKCTQEYIALLKKPKESNKEWTRSHLFALSCLGEFGKQSLLQSKDVEDLQSILLSTLQGSEESIKSHAARAYGAIALGDKSDSIRNLEKVMREHPQLRYLLLISMKEAILYSNSNKVAAAIPDLVPLLLDTNEAIRRASKKEVESSEGSDSNTISSSDSGEESVRTATSECLGILAQGYPEMVMPALVQATHSETAFVRTYSVTALKYAVTNNPKLEKLNDILGPEISKFLKLLSDKEVVVRKGAVSALNAFLKSSPHLIKPHLTETLPLLYQETVIKKELIRTIDLGPFKHTEDDGLDVRKAAFECMNGVFLVFDEQLDIGTFMAHLITGLTDHVDIRSSALHTLELVCKIGNPAVGVLSRIEHLTNSFKTILEKVPKQNAVRQEIERYEEAVRGSLKVIRLMELIPEVSSNQIFVQLINSVIRSEAFSAKYDQVVREMASEDDAAKKGEVWTESMEF